MYAILHALGIFVVNLFKSRRRLEAENLFLRHQLSVALRRSPPRLRLRDSDRALLVWMVRLWPDLAGLAQVVKPCCAGIGRASQPIGAGSRGRGQGGRGLIAKLGRQQRCVLMSRLQ
jgi:hypothetical protein